MDEAQLRELVDGGETLTIEFKSGTLNDRDLIEAVVCLANGSGGKLFVGVTDDGVIAGAPPRHGGRTDSLRLEALIAAKTEPAVVTKVSTVHMGERDVIVISIPSSTSVVGTSDGKFVRRALDVNGKPQCLPMKPHEVLSRAGSVGAQDYARVPLPELTLDHLSQSEFGRIRELAGADGDRAIRVLSDVEILKALDLLTPTGQLTIGALLLFGSGEALARFLPSYEVGFQELDGLEVRTSETRRIPLLRAMVELADRVKARNPEEEVEVGLFRVALPRFGDVAVRELIANALVHRDYTANGPTLVEISADAMTVSNPGGLPEGVTTSNLLTTPPRPRNPVLADAFKRAGLVDRTSRGINRVFESQLTLGRPAPDYGRSTQQSVVARVRSGPADRELAGFIAESRRNGLDFSLEDLLALHEVRAERRITTARAATLFQVDQHEARATLNRLADQGLLEARGDGKGRTYHMAAALYRRLGESAQYVRTRGFEQLQQEQMVLTYAGRHGSITRRDAAELCQIDSEQASRLLRRLRDNGRLNQVGERRAARYVPAGQEQ